MTFMSWQIDRLNSWSKAVNAVQHRFTPLVAPVLPSQVSFNVIQKVFDLLIRQHRLRSNLVENRSNLD